jgi:hypothetical protein
MENTIMNVNRLGKDFRITLRGNVVPGSTQGDFAMVRIYKSNNELQNYEEVKNFTSNESYGGEIDPEKWASIFLKNSGTDNEYFLLHVEDTQLSPITKRISPVMGLKAGGGGKRRRKSKKSKKRRKSKRKSKRRKSTKRKYKRR